jgi:ankyrin repeat protein
MKVDNRHCLQHQSVDSDVVKCLLSSDADINLRNKQGQSPLFIASQRGHCAIVKCLLSSGADINLRDEGGKSPLFVAISAGYHDIVRLLRPHGGLRKDNIKAHYKIISKGTNDNEILADRNALLNTSGYPEEEISHSTEKREDEKEAIYLPKVQEGKEETMHTKEQEGTEELIYTREEKYQAN